MSLNRSFNPLDKSEIGSLFTLFLHAPLLGFCAVSDIGNLEQTVWNQCVARVNDIEAKITDLLYAHHETGKACGQQRTQAHLRQLITFDMIDPSVLRFMQDDFLRSFIVRTVLCTVILRCHLSFKEEKVSLSVLYSLYLIKCLTHACLAAYSHIQQLILHYRRTSCRLPK
jgi:Protein SCAI